MAGADVGQVLRELCDSEDTDEFRPKLSQGRVVSSGGGSPSDWNVERYGSKVLKTSKCERSEEDLARRIAEREKKEADEAAAKEEAARRERYKDAKYNMKQAQAKVDGMKDNDWYSDDARREADDNLQKVSPALRATPTDADRVCCLLAGDGGVQRKPACLQGRGGE